jgi:hypothetical protein
MRIGLITTLQTNIGDDLIREGICLVLREVFKGHEIKFVTANKHHPLTVYPHWHPIHLKKLTRYLPKERYHANRLLEYFAPKLKSNRFDVCDLIVQCGGPVLWPNCHQNEWVGPLWREVVAQLYQRVPVLNMAAGSCYPWERQPSFIDNPDDEKYLHEIFGYCRLTTVRDKLAQNLYASMGMQTPLLPCSAFLAAKGYVGDKQKKDLVLINYMSSGGHYDWGQGIQPSEWCNTLKTLISKIKMRHRIAFLCHNQGEEHLAHELEPTLTRIYPKTTKEYLALVSEAQAGLCNRIHASVVLASLGIPSVAVGTDTRLLTVSELGLPIEYVKNTDIDRLEDQIERLIKDQKIEKERLFALQEETWERYLNIIKQAM